VYEYQATHGIPPQGGWCARAWRRHRLALIAIAVVVAAMAFGSGTASAQTKLLNLSSGKGIGQLVIPMRKSETVTLDQEFAEVLVGDETIADVLPMSNRMIYLLGKEIGSTNISLYNRDKRLIGVIDLEVSYDIPGIRARLKEELPSSRIKVSSVNGRVLLSGTAPSASAAARAVTIAEQYAPDAVSNAVNIGATQQVMLEVRFVEVSRSAGRELGVHWDVASNRVQAVVGTGLITGSPFGSVLGTLLNNGVDADVIVDALEERGLARRLAEPNLVALSGDTASFLAGGEFPFPVAAEDDRITIEFKRFGVGLNFTPTVLEDGLVNLQIEPEVSQLDPTNTLRSGGIEIPSLVVRRAQTTVELRDGQSFAIAGLLQSNFATAQRQLPWLGQVPILGALFRSASYQKDETDLVIIVTPRLVIPAVPGQRLATPLDNSVPGNDIDFFLLGQSEVDKDVIEFFRRGGNRAVPYGHMLVSHHAIAIPEPIAAGGRIAAAPWHGGRDDIHR